MKPPAKYPNGKPTGPQTGYYKPRDGDVKRKPPELTHERVMDYREEQGVPRNK